MSATATISLRNAAVPHEPTAGPIRTPSIAWLCAHGYDVLAFDYRSFGESEGRPRQVIDIRAQLADWEAALEFVRTGL